MLERIDRLSEAWDASELLRLAAPVFCVAWEAMLFSRAVLLGDGAGPDLTGSAMWQLLLVMAAGCCLLFVRHRRPLAVLGCELALAVAGGVLGWLSPLYFLPMVALYACVARGPWKASLAGAASYLAAMALALAADAGVSLGPDGLELPSGAAGGIISIAAISLAATGVALASHARWDRRVMAAEERRREEARAAEVRRMAAARDAALAKSRIAAELHDSVGHDLTAIIALSEGLEGATGDPSLDSAVASINELARAGLADTRRAVRALAAGPGEGATEGSAPWEPSGSDAPTNAEATAPVSGPRHRWDEIPALLEAPRAAGITAALTETGHRTPDSTQSDLAFRIVRESVTNALRHAEGLTRITVSLDNGEGGAVTVSVRNDGSCPNACGESTAAVDATGMGLARLRELVAAASGTLSAVPDDLGGWVVRAELPTLLSQQTESERNEGER